MTENKQLLIIGGVGIVGLALFWIMAQARGAATVPNGDGYGIDVPGSLAADNPTYQPASFALQAPANSNTALTNPGSLMLFNFDPGAFSLDNPAPGTQTGGTSAGTSSADGGTSGQCGCSSPACGQQGQATSTQFGGVADWARVMQPFTQKLAEQLPSGGYGVYDPTAKNPLQIGVAVLKQHWAQMAAQATWGYGDSIANWYGL